MRIPNVAGQLILGGFSGAELSASFRAALARGERGGAVLFKRNLPGDVLDIPKLTAQIAGASREDFPPLIAVDQEGGRVARVGAPALVLPPMRRLAGACDVAFLRRIAAAQGRELRALGFTMNLSPILDVHTNADNPIIGDRSFGSDAAEVARLGLAYAEGLEEGGVLACGKHYPGHGDTHEDSHLELPVVDHARARLEAVELVPFRAAAKAKLTALMSAHVVYPALDPSGPATLSRVICTDILRSELAFDGVLVSDDLEMKAIAEDVEQAAVLAVSAGCDMLLICSDEGLQERAHAALVREAERSATFRTRCEEAAERGLRARRRVRPRAVTSHAELRAVFEGSSRIREELALRLAKAGSA